MVIPGVAKFQCDACTTGSRSADFVFVDSFWYWYNYIVSVNGYFPAQSHTNQVLDYQQGTLFSQRKMAHESGLIDATPTTGLTAEFHYVQSLCCGSW